MLALSDILERSHPRLLERFLRVPEGRVERVEVPDAIVALGGPPEESELARKRSADLSVVVTERDEWLEIWVPAVGARQFLPSGADPLGGARDLVNELIAEWPVHRRAALLRAHEEGLHTLPVEAQPAPLGRFSGPDAAPDMLPEPAPDETEVKRKRADGRALPPTPVLDTLGLPLHELAEAGQLSRAYQRDALVDRLVQMLTVNAAPIVLLGPRGVGKSAVLDELAVRLAGDRAPEELRGHGLYFADAGRLIAGDGFFGQWQQQLLDVIQEAVASEVVWFLGELLPLLDAGKSAFSDQNVAQMLKPALATGSLRVIAECHEQAWAQLELRNPGFAGMFTPVRVPEPDPGDTLAILRGVAGDLEDEAVAAPGTLPVVLDLARRYGRRTSVVGAAVQLLRRVVDAVAAEQAAAHARAEREGPVPPAPLDRFRVVSFLCEETGLPEFLVRDDVPLDHADVVERFRARIMGQDAVIAQMADLVARIKAGVADDGRPLGAFLFIGPTGVGKTETVKALASLLYGREDRVLRFDMSEFAGPDCVDRLLGDDPSRGLVGRVAQSPFSVVLLDEVEKAHPAIFDLLLQILGEARLSDRSGRLADFRNSVVLMTSNLGVDTFRRPSGFGASVERALRDHLVGEVHRFFRPELVGRLDEIVAFEPLGAEPIARITERELAKVQRREGLRGRQIGLALGNRVAPWLAERGVDLRYGARPLKRTIERRLVVPLAKALSHRKRPPRTLGVSARPRSLKVRASEEASAVVGLDEALSPALTRCSALRWRLRAWAGVQRFRDATHAVRLVDRLANTRVFWRDLAAARARMNAVTESRELTEAHGALVDQAEALEDLLLEAWSGLVPALSDEARDELLGGVADAEAALERLEWRIASLGEPPSGIVTLWIERQGNAHTVRSMEPLIFAYLRLAVDAGCTVRPAVRSDRAWTQVEEPSSDLEQLNKVVRSWSRSTGVRLHVTGAVAAPMFGPERGIHYLPAPGNSPGGVQVAFRNGVGRGGPDPRSDCDTVVQRELQLSRNRVRDRVLRKELGLGRLHDVLRRFIRERMLRRFFDKATAERLS